MGGAPKKKAGRRQTEIHKNPEGQLWHGRVRGGEGEGHGRQASYKFL